MMHCAHTIITRKHLEYSMTFDPLAYLDTCCPRISNLKHIGALSAFSEILGRYAAIDPIAGDADGNVMMSHIYWNSDGKPVLILSNHGVVVTAEASVEVRDRIVTLCQINDVAVFAVGLHDAAEAEAVILRQQQQHPDRPESCPGGSGLEILARLREKGSTLNTKSVSSQTKTEQRARDFNAADYLEACRPALPMDLLLEVVAYMGQNFGQVDEVETRDEGGDFRFRMHWQNRAWEDVAHLTSHGLVLEAGLRETPGILDWIADTEKEMTAEIPVLVRDDFDVDEAQAEWDRVKAGRGPSA